MKLIFDLNSLRPPRSGVGYYAQHLLEGLLKRSDLADVIGWVGGHVYKEEELLALIHDKDVLRKAVQYSGGISAAALRFARNVPGVYRGRTISRTLRSSKLRGEYAKQGYLYHETNYVTSPYEGRTVMTLHDISHHRNPEYHPRFAVEYLNREIPKSLKRATKVIAVSEFTKREIHEIYGLPDDQVIAIPLGVEPIFRRYSDIDSAEVLAELGLKHRQFVLSACTLQPRKNLERLVLAFARLTPELRREFPLILLGAEGWMTSGLKRLMSELLSKGELLLPGYVSRDKLVRLMSSAAAFAYPSLYEGFGLPVVEAMACGVPVLTSNVTSLPEVAGGAAIEVDPLAVDAIADGLERLLTDASLRDTLIVKGLARAKDFTWDATVEKTLEVYRSTEQ